MVSLKGINNPAYKDGNRIKGRYPCPDCGKDRFIEKRYAKESCLNCAESGERNGNWKGGTSIKQNYPCPECGKDRFCLEVNAWRVCKSCAVTGKNNVRWLGGKKSYLMNKARQVMEVYLGRKLTSKEEVHHLDHNRWNWDISNLHLFQNSSKHIKYHRMIQRFIKEELELCGTKMRYVN